MYTILESKNFSLGNADVIKMLAMFRPINFTAIFLTANYLTISMFTPSNKKNVLSSAIKKTAL